MFTQTDLENEVKELVLNSKTRMTSSWYATKICNDHPMPKSWKGDDAEFTLVCRGGYAQHCVREVLRKMKLSNESDPQQIELYPGAKYLHKIYLIKNNDGEYTSVPLDEMTKDEIDAKADELEKNAKSLMNHAKELRRFGRNKYSGQKRLA